MRLVWAVLFAFLAVRFLYLAVTMHALFIVHIGLLIAAVVMAENALDEFEKRHA